MEGESLEDFIKRNSYYGEGKVGNKYWETRHMDIKDIAKSVRADIKASILKGKASIKIDRFAGGQSIDVKFVRSNLNGRDQLMYIHFLRDILDQYNYDFSSGMHDYSSVRFYSHVSVE